MATSSLKFVVGAAAVVVGIVVLAQAFESPGVPAAQPTATASPSPEPAKDGPKKDQKPAKQDGGPAGQPDQPAGQQDQPAGQDGAQVQGVEVGVFNGTDETGLADRVAKQLERRGYVAGQVGNSDDVGASASLTETTLYYRAGPDKVEAEELADSFFEGAAVRKLTKDIDVDKAVQVAILIGSDFNA
ncbi:MAG: LytR C-terminal domain-containing protein [Actinomycetota bacterium]